MQVQPSSPSTDNNTSATATLNTYQPPAKRQRLDVSLLELLAEQLGASASETDSSQTVEEVQQYVSQSGKHCPLACWKEHAHTPHTDRSTDTDTSGYMIMQLVVRYRTPV